MIRVIILCAFVLLVTLLIFALCRGYSPSRSMQQQRVIVTLYFTDFDVFEPVLLQISKLCCHFDVTIRVIDMISTEESIRWLEKLSEKTDIRFDIIRK